MTAQPACPRESPTIRRATAADALALAEVFQSSVHRLTCAHYDARQRTAWGPDDRDWPAWCAQVLALRPVVAVRDNRVVGYADVQPDGYIDHVYVHGEHAAQGVGTALLRHLVHEAACQGISVLSADVSLSAEAFFRRHGFAVVARQNVQRYGVTLANARMTRTL